jgi:hypothetical protein
MGVTLAHSENGFKREENQKYRLKAILEKIWLEINRDIKLHEILSYFCIFIA